MLAFIQSLGYHGVHSLVENTLLQDKGSTMTPDELMIVARSHTPDIPKLSGEPWATLEKLPKITITDAVVVCFESEQRPGKMFVVLERASGKFVVSGVRKHTI